MYTATVFLCTSHIRLCLCTTADVPVCVYIRIHTLTLDCVTVLPDTRKDLRVPACLRFPVRPHQSRNYHSVVQMKWTDVLRLLSLLQAPKSHCPYPPPPQQSGGRWLEYLHKSTNSFPIFHYGRHIAFQKAPTEVKIVGGLIRGTLTRSLSLNNSHTHTHTHTPRF